MFFTEQLRQAESRVTRNQKYLSRDGVLEMGQNEKEKFNLY